MSRGRGVNQPSIKNLCAMAYELDWSIFEGQWLEFHSWLTERHSMDRKRKRYLPHAGGIDKIKSSTQDNLARLVMDHGYDPVPDMKWLGDCAWDIDELKIVFQSFADHMEIKRGNDADYIAKRMRDLKPAIEWAMMQNWYFDVDYQEYWRVPDNEMMQTIEYMDNLCRTLNAEGEKKAKCKRELKKLLVVTISLEEFKARMNTHNMSVMRAVDFELSNAGMLDAACNEGVGELSDETACDLMGLLAMESVAYGGRANDTHRLIWAGDDKEWVREMGNDGVWQENDSLLLRTIGGSPKYTIMTPNAKNHFVLKALHSHTHLIDRVLECFSEIERGSLIFRPDCWGRRVTKVPKGPLQVMHNRFFMTSLRFAEYIKIVSKAAVGTELRPYTIRRMLTTDSARKTTSMQLRESEASMLGTSVRTMHKNYDRRTELEKSSLAVQRVDYQFDLRLDDTKQTSVLPFKVEVPTPSGMIETRIHARPARFVRQQLNGSKVYAVFEQIQAPTGSHPTLEMGSTLYCVGDEVAEALPIADLIPDEVTGRQLWRHANRVAQKAMVTFDDIGWQGEEHGRCPHKGLDEAWVDTAIAACIGLGVPVAGDFVYAFGAASASTFAFGLALVEEVLDNNTMQVAFLEEARDLPKTNMRSFYRFYAQVQGTQIIQMEDAKWPLDLAYNSSEGHFVLRKSMNLVYGV